MMRFVTIMTTIKHSEGAHFNQAKWSAAKRASSVMALCICLLLCSLASTATVSVNAVSVAQALASENQAMANAYSKGGGAAAANAASGGRYQPSMAQAMAHSPHGGSALAHTVTGAANPFKAPVTPLVARPPPPPPPTAAPTPAPTPAPAPVVTQNPIVAQLEMRKKLAAQRAAKQAEIDALLKELLEIEERPSDSMDECSHWYDLSLKYNKLTGQSAPARESEIKKKDDCDALYKFVEDTRAKFKAFTTMAHENQIEYILYVTSIVHDYLDLKYATSLNEQLAKEFDYLVQSDEEVRKQVEELENFLNYMREALKPAEEAAAEAAADEPTVAAAEAAAEGGAEPSPDAAMKELRELDNIIKDLIDKEEEISGDEVEQLAELGGMLDRALGEGLVPLNSGRFHYLSGTLNAVRAIIVRKMVESGVEARQKAEEEAAAEAAKKAAEEEEAARKAAEEEEEAARKKAEADALLEAMKARLSKPPPPPPAAAKSVAAAQTHSNHAAAMAAGDNASAHAQTHNTLAQAHTRGNSAAAYSHVYHGGSASAFAGSG